MPLARLLDIEASDRRKAFWMDEPKHISECLPAWLMERLERERAAKDARGIGSGRPNGQEETEGVETASLPHSQAGGDRSETNGKGPGRVSTPGQSPAAREVALNGGRLKLIASGDGRGLNRRCESPARCPRPSLHVIEGSGHATLAKSPRNSAAARR